MYLFIMETHNSSSRLMARLIISALDQITMYKSTWKEPVVHRAILLGGLSVLIQSAQFVENDLNKLQDL